MKHRVFPFFFFPSYFCNSVLHLLGSRVCFDFSVTTQNCESYSKPSMVQEVKRFDTIVFHEDQYMAVKFTILIATIDYIYLSYEAVTSEECLISYV